MAAKLEVGNIATQQIKGKLNFGFFADKKVKNHPFTLKSFQDENQGNKGWLDIGSVGEKPMDTWEHIQMLETIQKKDIEITSISSASIMISGNKYSSKETTTYA